MLLHLLLLLTFQLVQKRNVLSKELGRKKKKIIRNCAVCDMLVEIPPQR